MAKPKEGKIRLFSLYIDGMFSKVMKAYTAKSAKHAAKKAYPTRNTRVVEIVANER